MTNVVLVTSRVTSSSHQTASPRVAQIAGPCTRAYTAEDVVPRDSTLACDSPAGDSSVYTVREGVPNPNPTHSLPQRRVCKLRTVFSRISFSRGTRHSPLATRHIIFRRIPFLATVGYIRTPFLVDDGMTSRIALPLTTATTTTATALTMKSGPVNNATTSVKAPNAPDPDILPLTRKSSLKTSPLYQRQQQQQQQQQQRKESEESSTSDNHSSTTPTPPDAIPTVPAPGSPHVVVLPSHQSRPAVRFSPEQDGTSTTSESSSSPLELLSSKTALPSFFDHSQSQTLTHHPYYGYDSHHYQTQPHSQTPSHHVPLGRAARQKQVRKLLCMTSPERWHAAAASTGEQPKLATRSSSFSSSSFSSRRTKPKTPGRLSSLDSSFSTPPEQQQ